MSGFRMFSTPQSFFYYGYYSFCPKKPARCCLC